ncbi:hypothetical protein IMCC3317_40520 [Kordia antarctica]|uniref:Uncharacterized protein n=1 Tax=Kordia antarctica TaxID=1218801 RepID=A0A7L4ZPK4_9FLAO|nr:hypothetical protein [Kordia antarctica]QHI38658.1 hypothetical protein IMCC3317_40520 [Kordia antarctica]
MANYRLNIARFVDLEAKANNSLKAIVSIQYPIYYIHAEIVDTKPHVLYELDKVVVNSSKVLKSFDNDNIAKLLSLPSSVIKSRKAYLQHNEYIDKNDVLNGLGENYISTEEEKMEHHISQDFVIDGISLKPLPQELYNYNYKDEYIFESDYDHYTNKNGETVSRRPFSPDLTHQPIQKDIIEKNLLTVAVSERGNYNIPIGLKTLSSLSYSVCTLPIFIGLFENNGVLKRKLINGFDSLGRNDDLKVFLPNLEKRITNLELRLNEWGFKDGNSRLNFESNWREIDLKREEDKLFFFSKEDLKNFFNQNYQIVKNEKSWKEDIELEDVFYEANSLGIIVTCSVFEKARFKKELLANVKRRSDYYLQKNTTSGVWTIFFDMIQGDDFIRDTIEFSSLIDDLRNERFPKEKILAKIITYKNYRKILVALEEYRLLEEIDIMNHMINLLNE